MIRGISWLLVLLVLVLLLLLLTIDRLSRTRVLLRDLKRRVCRREALALLRGLRRRRWRGRRS